MNVLDVVDALPHATSIANTDAKKTKLDRPDDCACSNIKFMIVFIWPQK